MLLYLFTISLRVREAGCQTLGNCSTYDPSPDTLLPPPEVSKIGIRISSFVRLSSHGFRWFRLVSLFLPVFFLSFLPLDAPVLRTSRPPPILPASKIHGPDGAIGVSEPSLKLFRCRLHACTGGSNLTVGCLAQRLYYDYSRSTGHPEGAGPPAALNLDLAGDSKVAEQVPVASDVITQ